MTPPLPSCCARSYQGDICQLPTGHNGPHLDNRGHLIHAWPITGPDGSESA